MSHDQGIALARQTMHKPQGKPSLDRPSLFAGQDHGHSDADDSQRVRILSTLESSRRPNLPPSRRDKASKSRGWLPTALIGLMALGGVSLLMGFVLVIQQGHSDVARASTPPPALSASVLIQPAQSANAAASQALPAVVASAPAPLEHNPLQALDAATVLDVAASAELTPAPKPNANKSTSSPKPLRASKEPKTEAATAKPERQKPRAAKHDEDVALLEAMFTHAGPRKAPVSAAEDIRKRCGGTSGAEASACRAKVCAQHPKSQLCRD